MKKIFIVLSLILLVPFVFSQDINKKDECPITPVCAGGLRPVHYIDDDGCTKVRCEGCLDGRKLCPDRVTFVDRVPPSCEFESCPDEAKGECPVVSILCVERTYLEDYVDKDGCTKTRCVPRINISGIPTREYDLNNDSVIDNSDLIFLRAIIGRYNQNSDVALDIEDLKIIEDNRGDGGGKSDVNGDGIVDNSDLIFLKIKISTYDFTRDDKVDSEDLAVIEKFRKDDDKPEFPDPEDVELNEKFKLRVGQEVEITNYKGMEIQFLGISKEGCSDREVYSIPQAKKPVVVTARATLVSQISEIEDIAREVILEKEEVTICKGGHLIAKLRVSMKEEPTKFVSIRLGESKEVFGVTLSFLDFFSGPGVGVFLVSSEVIDCPNECVCSADGTMACPLDDECRFGYTLCPDGECRKECDVDLDECKFGCLYEESCLPIGTRTDGLYCDIGRDMEKQLGGNDFCENNFECKTNFCLDGQCIEPGMMQQIIQFFRRFFD